MLPVPGAESMPPPATTVYAVVWTCPKCERQFGAKGQGHHCEPGVTVEQFLSSARPEAAPIFHRVHDHLRSLDGGELIVDPLAKKVLFKNGPTFAILDSMTKWVALGFTIYRKLPPDRFSRKINEYQGRYHHVLNLTDVDQVDDEVLDWLAESFYGPAGLPDDAGGGSMVPDDVDVEF